MSIFEILMLLCFGAAWPLNIYKSLVTKQTAGKSVVFLFVVMAGYVAGIVHKVLNSFDLVAYLHLLNLLMVGFDTVLYFRNKRLDACDCAPQPSVAPQPAAQPVLSGHFMHRVRSGSKAS
jgi:hypothetical protein